jgi:hypothetical protein
LFAGNARSQSHVKVAGRGHRLKTANQLAQARAFSAKVATRRANGEMRQSLIAQSLVQF